MMFVLKERLAKLDQRELDLIQIGDGGLSNSTKNLADGIYIWPPDCCVVRRVVRR